MADEANKIAQKIVLEGEKEYSAALKEAQRNLKVLRSELKAETAELGKNATEQQKNETRIKNLQKQIKEQEKVVRTYEKALKEVREKYGDNEEAIAKWEIKLNDARTALANMRNSLDDTSKSMKGVGDSADMSVVASNSLADSLGKVADAGYMVSGALEEAFSGIVGTIADTVSQVWENVVNLAARSNNLVDLAGFWNTDVTTIQKYKGAVSEVSGTLEDLNSLVTKINQKDGKDITELVGVSKENYKDQWEYAMAVMDAMSQMDTEKRNEVGFEIFGKGATKAFDLLNDWQNMLGYLDKYDVTKGGYGLSEEQLQTMSELYDKVNGLKQSWSDLQDMATVELFGDLALNITGNIQNIIDAFKDYFQADTPEKKQEALQKVRDNIIEAFKSIKQAIEDGLKLLDDLAEELKGSDDSTVRALGNILDQIVEALQWFTKEENWGAVKRGFEALIGIWAAGKVAGAVGNIASFAAHMKTIGLFGGSTAASAGTAAGTSWGSAFGAAVLKAVPWLAGLITLLTPAQTGDALGNNDIVDEEGKLTQEAQAYGYHLDEKGNVVEPKLEPLILFPEDNKGDITQAQREATEALWDVWRKGPEGYTEEEFDQAWENFEKAFEGNEEVFNALNASLDKLYERLDTGEGLDSYPDLTTTWWKSNGYSVDENGITQTDLNALQQIPGKLKQAVLDGMGDIVVKMDGHTVGVLVAPYVSQQIAADLNP